MTDLRHIAQLLHEAGVSEGLGPTAMATWLGRRIHEADRDAENEERARRLESDAEAVQVITIHRSKGLEFPIVFCPYMWDGSALHERGPGVPRSRQRQRAHDRRRATRQRASPVHQKMELEEEPGRGPAPALRGPHPGPAPGGAVVGRGHGQPALAAVPAALRPRRPGRRAAPTAPRRAADARRRGGRHRAWGPRCRWSASAAPRTPRWEADAGAPPQLEAAVFDRTLDVELAPRASYSGITRALHEQPADRQRARGSSSRRTRTCRRSSAQDAAGGRSDEDRLRSVALGAGRHARRRAGRDRRARRVGAHRLRRRPTSTAEVAAARRPRGGVAQRRPRRHDAVVAGSVRRHRVAPRAPGRRHRAARHRAPRPARRARIRASAGRRRRPRRRRCTSRTWPTCSRQHLPADDPVARYADRLRDPALGGVLRGLPDREPRPGVPAARATASSWPTTRRTGSARPTSR